MERELRVNLQKIGCAALFSIIMRERSWNQRFAAAAALAVGLRNQHIDKTRQRSAKQRTKERTTQRRYKRFSSSGATFFIFQERV